MKVLLSQKSSILSCRGSITVEFLLGFILILSFVMLFSVMTLTLAVSEITQYITYAASRALFLSDGRRDLQIKSAKDKYKELSTSQHFDKLFKPGLFKIKAHDALAKENGFGYNGKFGFASDVPYLFYGVWTDFTPKVLEVDTLWGGTEEDEAFFKTSIGSYLGRESTLKECENFVKKRWERISREHGSIPSAVNPAVFYNNNYSSYLDNGC